MSRVMYNGKRLIPAPQVTVTKTYESTADGTKVGAQWNITLNGLFVAWMGSPNSSGTFWTAGGFPPDENITESHRLAAVIRKGEALRGLFSIDGQTLEFQSDDGSAPMKCNPKVESVQLSEGTWYDRLAYTVTLTAPYLSVNGQDVGEDSFTAYIDSADESWQIETNEEPESYELPRTYRMSHTVSAKGKRVFNPDGTLQAESWEQARAYVIPKLGMDASKKSSSGVLDLLPSYNNYNHVRTESIDKMAGNYSVTETWLLASGSALETYQISFANSLDSSLTKVTIDGTITGLEVRDPTTMALVSRKFDNAKTMFTSISGYAYSRAQQYASNVDSSVSLNIQPLTTQVTQMPAAGNITYNFEFDDRPSNLITGARLETINITDILPTDFVVPIFVLGRAKGPVLQNLNTSKETTRTLNLECVMNKSYGPFTVDNNPRIGSNVQEIIDSVAPTGNQVYKQDRQETWDIKTGRYTHTATWIWEK